MDTRGNNKIYYFFLILTFSFALFILILFAYNMTAKAAPVQENDYTLSINERVIRGSIYDRNNTLIATEVPSYSLTAWIPAINDFSKTAELLAESLEEPAENLLKRLKSTQGFLYIKRGLSQEEKKAIENELQKNEISGIYFEKAYGRYYPFHELAAQTIGFVNIDNQGLTGLEYFFNDQLYPLPNPSSAVTFGDDISLTLDMNIQKNLHKALLELYLDHSPDGISGIVMDADNGDILAMSSFPVFDLNNYRKASEEALRNRTVSLMYEPGSVFKVFSLAAILESGQADLNSRFFCDGSSLLELDNGSRITVNCVHPHGNVGPREVIKYSCNGAIANYALQVSDSFFYNSLLNFGFSARTGLPLTEETSGILPHPDNWSSRSKPTIAFGQESGVTAIQIATAATALTNNGVLLKPNLVKRIESNNSSDFKDTKDTTVKDTTRIELGSAISKKTAERILDYMTAAVEQGGTAHGLQNEDFTIAAKTGTAQLMSTETGEYSKERYLSSCLAIFPYKKPQYIVYIAADNPKSGEIYGSSVVVPYLRKLINELKVDIN
ncbi:MAG: penicillin-binding protein 2 [Spirochaetia bacterium]|nr:penicillin-binding protein 2 [Spirochaetia bacterium]